jgi:hypothetical protein
MPMNMNDGAISVDKDIRRLLLNRPHSGIDGPLLEPYLPEGAVARCSPLALAWCRLDRTLDEFLERSLFATCRNFDRFINLLRS